MGKGVRGHFPTKTKQMWLETPAAQGPAQGPRKVQGAPGRQGGIVDKIPAAGSPWLLTDQLTALLLNHCKYQRYLYSLDAKSLQIQRYLCSLAAKSLQIQWYLDSRDAK